MHKVTICYALQSAAVLLALSGPLSAFGAGGNVGQPFGEEKNEARFRSVPITTPSSPLDVYPYGYNPYGNYWSGQAGILAANGQMMVNQQQAFLMKEQVRQARIDTRHKGFDEYLYERNMRPTTEDERERDRIENLRRSRNDPPVSEIWSGKALNDLLLAIQQKQALGQQGPKVAIAPDVMGHINVAATAGRGSIGLLRDDGHLSWPQILSGEEYADDRKALDQLSSEAYKQAQAGRVSGRTIQEMNTALGKLQSDLKRNVDFLSANDYIRAKRFVSDLEDTIGALQDPSVTNFVSGKWTPKATAVEDLAKQMTAQGLKFAAAVPGDEAAYQALHSSLVAYLGSIADARRWDPLAK
jgi:hypothetical protein